MNGSTLQEKIGSYLEWLDHRGSSEVTIYRYESELRLILIYLEEVGIIEVGDLTMEVIPILESWMMDKGLKPRSRAKTLSVFKSFTQYLKQTSQILFNIGSKITMPRLQKIYREVPSREEVKMLLDAPDKTSERGMRDHLVLSLLYWTGMRANELANAFTTNLNLRERRIKIFGKGSHQRILYFPLSVAIDLKKYLKGRNSFTLFNLTSNQVSSIATTYLKKVGLPQTGAHILRYSIATHMFERGINVRLIQTMLGHKELKSTYEYILPRVDYLKEVHFKHHPFERGFFDDE